MADAKSLIQKYFPQDQWNNAYNVMMGESGGNHQAVGDNFPIRGETIPSYGLFQIRGLPGRPNSHQLLDPEFNVKYAANMYKAQGWQPWTAAQKLGLTGGGTKQLQTTHPLIASLQQKMGMPSSSGYSDGGDQQAYGQMQQAQRVQQASQYLPYLQQLADRVQQRQIPQVQSSVDLSPYTAFAQNAHNRSMGGVV